MFRMRGTPTAASTPITTMTMSSSMNVKPLRMANPDLWKRCMVLVSGV
jgi:hypothetical protein